MLHVLVSLMHGIRSEPHARNRMLGPVAQQAATQASRLVHACIKACKHRDGTLSIPRGHNAGVEVRGNRDVLRWVHTSIRVSFQNRCALWMQDVHLHRLSVAYESQAPKAEVCTDTAVALSRAETASQWPLQTPMPTIWHTKAETLRRCNEQLMPSTVHHINKVGLSAPYAGGNPDEWNHQAVGSGTIYPARCAS